jgi:acyl-CoA synthetase (NDP forming)
MIRTDFQGEIYPVNPNASEIQGLKAYPSVRDIPNGVDLAVIAVPREAVPGAEAVALSERIGFPVALKLVSTRILHKSDVGGVQLILSDADAVEAAFARIQSELSSRNQLEAMDGVLVQKMISGGVELMAGVAADPVFGSLIAFGLGGIHVEILGDVQFRIAPLTDKDVREMVRSIRGFKLVEGYRGHAPADLSAIEDVLLRVSRMVELLPENSELDLNPLVALPPGQGCFVLDARMHLTAPGKPQSV